jgi:hypothetical protein
MGETLTRIEAAVADTNKELYIRAELIWIGLTPAILDRYEPPGPTGP